MSHPHPQKSWSRNVDRPFQSIGCHREIHLSSPSPPSFRSTTGVVAISAPRYPLKFPQRDSGRGACGLLHHRDPPTYTYIHIYTHIRVTNTCSHRWAVCKDPTSGGGWSVGGGGGVIASAQIEYISYVFITTAPGPRPSLPTICSTSSYTSSRLQRRLPGRGGWKELWRERRRRVERG